MKYKGKLYTTDGFWMDEREVTLAEFAEFVAATDYVTVPEREKGGQHWSVVSSSWEYNLAVSWRNDRRGNLIPYKDYPNFPVTNITPQDAAAYAAWRGKRLPTWKEWIYAAAGGQLSKGYKYSGSNKYDRVAWVSNNTDDILRPVKTKQPNELGLYDMSGSAYEMVVKPDGGHQAVGGAYFSDADVAEILSSGWPVRINESFPTFGFRCVKDK